jgi:hypothetical protein
MSSADKRVLDHGKILVIIYDLCIETSLVIRKSGVYIINIRGR